MQEKFPQRPQQKKFYVLLLCLVTSLFLGGCSTRKVQTVKVEAEANQIIDVLHEYNIKADKVEAGEGERKTFEIMVDGGDEERAAAIQLMEDHCLGQPLPEKIEGGTVVTSMGVEKAREQRLLKINIESQLRQIPGATCVNITFVPPEDRSMSLNPYQSTASVLINYKTPTFPVAKEDVAGMVAASVPALKAENVRVVLAAKPLRSLPDLQKGYEFRRMALVTGIGSAIILSFVGIVFFLQKQRKQKALAVAEDKLEIYENEEPMKRTSLLDDVYEPEDDDDDGIRLP